MTGAADWIGRVGDVWAQEWRRTDRSLADLSVALDAAIRDVAPEQGRAVDIGCGAGGTALALATARPALAVTGVDLSPALLEVARERAGGAANLAFVAGDAADVTPDLAALDLLVSRHGVMFFDDPATGFAALRAAAAPGARLVFSCFRARAENGWARVIDAAVGADVTASTAPGPFALADRDRTAAILADAGWQDAIATAVDFRYVMGEGADPVADALAFAARIGPAAPVLAAAPPDRRAAIRATLAGAFAAAATDEAVAFTAAAWIWSARA